MAPDPTLIIQLQRMGDLVLSFPLMAWLRRMEPDRPVWVVAEPEFHQALMPFAPDVVFFGPEAADALARTAFHRVINLSHRPEGQALAGRIRAAEALGTFGYRDGLRVAGDWHLYRASIVHNNRHNRLHWADLAALDVVPHRYLPLTRWPESRPPGRDGRIGLFVGASEADKRPDAAFWSALAIGLIKRGFNPVFLGGKADKGLAGEAARLAGIPRSNLADHFSLEKFAQFVARLDLLVTPDTGPMHVGAWVGTRTLNLSMGPVNAWETAPPVPGHLVLRAEPSCAGCWHCTRTRSVGRPPCQTAFSPGRVSGVIQAMMHEQAHRLHVPGLRLLRTARDERGLFDLQSLDLHPARSRDRLGSFWREVFLHLLRGPTPRLTAAAEALREADPALTRLMVRHASALIRAVAQGMSGTALWHAVPPLLRPLSGYLQMRWENSDRTADDRAVIMEQARKVLDALALDA